MDEDAPQTHSTSSAFSAIQGAGNHAHTSVDSSTVSFPNLSNRSRFIFLRLAGATTVIAGSTTSIGGGFTLPFSGTFSQNAFISPTVWISVDTGTAAGTVNASVYLNGSLIMSTSLTILTSTTTSRTNPTQPTFTTTNFKFGDVLSVNTNAVSGTPEGLTLNIRVTEMSI